VAEVHEMVKGPCCLTDFDIWATSLLNTLSARSALLDDAIVVVTKAGVPVPRVLWGVGLA